MDRFGQSKERHRCCQSTIPAQLGEVHSVNAGFEYTCAIRANDSRALCWGGSDWNQSIVPTDLGEVRSVSLGYRHSCALRIDGLAQCWGSSESFRNADYRSIDILENLGAVHSVSAGFEHTCVVRAADGMAQCMGGNHEGSVTVPDNIDQIQVWCIPGWYMLMVIGQCVECPVGYFCEGDPAGPMQSALSATHRHPQSWRILRFWALSNIWD